MIYTVDNTKIGDYTVTLTCTDTLTSSTAFTPYLFSIAEMIYTKSELLMPYYFKFDIIKIKPGYKGTKPIYIDVYKTIQFFNVFTL